MLCGAGPSLGFASQYRSKAFVPWHTESKHFIPNSLSTSTRAIQFKTCWRGLIQIPPAILAHGSCLSEKRAVFSIARWAI
jgi:hypothetical protein